jgi:Tetratricopeptide repeat
VADRERVLGADHPQTLSSRYHLALAYQEAGRTDEAKISFTAVAAVTAKPEADPSSAA